MRLGVDDSSRAAAESANLADSLSEETDKGLTVGNGAIESIHNIQSGVAATQSRSDEGVTNAAAQRAYALLGRFYAGTFVDDAVDVAHDLPRKVRDIFEAALAPAMAFTTLFDLNAYLPAHNGRFTRDWTGDHGKDLAQNRTKRSFLESPELLRACRHGLGVELPPRSLSRPELESMGCALGEPDCSARDFLVQTYARDTGAVMVLVSVPLYVAGRRFGAVCAAWEPREPASG